MNCRRVYQTLVRHDLEDRHPGEVEEHLSDCPDCRRAYEELVFVDQSIKAALRFEQQPGFWRGFEEGLKIRLDEAKKPARKRAKKTAEV